MDGSGIEFRWGRDFPLLSRPVLETPSRLCSGYRLFFRGGGGVKWPGRGIDHPPYLLPRLKKEWSHTFLPLFAFMAFSGVNFPCLYLYLLPQSHDCSSYVSRPILAPPPVWPHKHTDLRTHDFAHSPDLWHNPRLADVTYAWSWRFCGITPDIYVLPFQSSLLWSV
jgi:hypothetical protein